MDYDKTPVFIEEAVDKQKNIIRIGKGEPIFRILCSLVIAVIFLGFPYVIGFWASALPWVPESFRESPNGYWIPLFMLNTLNSLWFLVIIWTAACLIGEVIKMIISRYTRTYALTTTVSSALILISTGLFFLHPRIMNVEFISLLNWYFVNPMPDFTASLLKNSNIIIFVTVLIVAIIECVLTWVKTAKYDKTDETEKDEKESIVLDA